MYIRLEPPILTILAYRGALRGSVRTRNHTRSVRVGKRIDYVLVIRIIFLITVISTVLIANGIWQARPITWSHERQITNGSGESRLVDISTDPYGKVVYLAWQDDRDGKVEVYYKRSLDDGVTWGSDVRLSNLTPETPDPEPRLGTDGHIVLVVFSNRTPTGEHLFYVVSNDGGGDFSAPIELTHDPGDQSNTALAFVGSTVHVVWQERLNDGEEHILYAESANAGVTSTGDGPNKRYF